MEFRWMPEQLARYREALEAAGQYAPGTGVPGIDAGDWLALGKHGLLGASVPRLYCGGRLPALDPARFFEAFGRGCPDTGLIFAAAAHLFACAMPISDFGSPALRKRLLPSLC